MIADTIFVVLFLCYYNANAWNFVASIENLFEDYGNWCGGPHGGFYDCCDGKPCSDCIKGESSPSKACLLQCNPIDAIDLACAHHDFCSSNSAYELHNPTHCSIQGNPCQCDCQLVKDAKAVSANSHDTLDARIYSGLIQGVFTDITSCREANHCKSPPHSFGNCASPSPTAKEL